MLAGTQAAGLMAQLSGTAARALAAYGGAELWQKARQVTAVADASGLAFVLKRRPYFRQAQLVVDVHRPYARLTPIGHRPGVVGVLDGGNVRLEDASGRVLASRSGARRYFPGGRRLLYWDDLDMAYFANYAFWNYLTLPALLLNPAIGWTELRPGVLQARFPPQLPTHSSVQTFFFDWQTGLLLQHNYVAEVIGKWARAANAVQAHDQQDGLVYASTRHVSPQKPGGAPLGWPALIKIRLHSCRLVF
ncbi:MAG: hypothetical protein ACK5XP_08150 [Sphingobacteriia bacterium]|jgi:hypothetical protein